MRKLRQIKFNVKNDKKNKVRVNYINKIGRVKYKNYNYNYN